MTHPKYGFAECVEIIRRLRSENGCPWDNEQTIHSLRKYFLEETYEALDAMDRPDGRPRRQPRKRRYTRSS